MCTVPLLAARQLLQMSCLAGRPALQGTCDFGRKDLVIACLGGICHLPNKVACEHRCRVLVA